MPRQSANKIGDCFGRLTIIDVAGIHQDGGKLWLCRCECGNEKIIRQRLLRSSATQSCGCLAIEMTIFRSMKHGEACTGKITSEYRMWCGMISRCHNRNDKNYQGYGGRGITVFPLWRQSYDGFLSHVVAVLGRKPSLKHSIDRINNNGNYEPGNLRWATVKEQANNRRSNCLVMIDGVTRTLGEWVDYSGTKRTLVVSRLKHGKNVKEAIFAGAV